MAQNRWFANLVLIFIAVVWGITFVLIQDAIETLPPFAFTTIRFMISFVILAIYVQFLPKERFRFKAVNYYNLKAGFFPGFFLF
ncbi:EamA family transporter [Polycladomyces sp. WAk]|uniref:EamA family transporter n=1 Tax=Polycladomyces zharkentensis TaxID=2807616 RepID=A0ABS2WLH3_9BACL|nr:EamA family transporter [Polycladomyces sp. WAk]MBN2910383.1 EamA family transporter [Polycladomyces sp. WAk]